GKVWTTTRAQLRNGTLLQAYGRGMSLRGAKHLNQRPDFCVLDDIEDENSVTTPESIKKTMRYITATVLPAMDRKGKHWVRMAATPLHPDAACVQLSRANEQAGIPSLFHTIKVPVYAYDPETSELKSAWPERNPLNEMLDKKDEYEALGMARE